MKRRHYKMLLMAGVMASCAADESEIVIGLKEPIHHDDFEYSVTSYTIEEKIGGENALTAKGNFYIVNIQVTNEAKRVKHPWNNEIAYVKDDEGNIYENSQDAQRRLDKQKPMGWQEEYVTEAQDQNSILLVFDLPKNVKHPCLMVRGETLMGDFFDGGKFKRTKVKLFE